MPSQNSWSYRNVILKGLLLFLAVNLGFAWLQPLPNLGKISIYNLIIPGRTRLPYGDNPKRSYNLSLFNLEAMFASHTIAGRPKQADEYRVILIGDSSVWGYLLQPNETLDAQLNATGLKLPDGRSIRVYNLGYPVMSISKDLLILSYAMAYQPDLVVWPITLESLPYDKQLFSPLIQNNPTPMRRLIQEYKLALDANDVSFVDPSFFERTLVGQRRQIADILRLQAYGVLWAATGIDQDIPMEFTPRQEDVTADDTFHGITRAQLLPQDIALDILEAGVQIASPVPILFVNEPIFISQGENSDIRYNFFYPRWAFDGFRNLMAEEAASKGWQYLDAWDRVPAVEFTNTAIHMTPRGTGEFAALLSQAILKIAARP